ncbi:N-acetyltransferase [Fusobacteria bacterium ZRK30]|nr:N-acetyltransferase [Fusobacteria bacterium ZRK30]
MENIAIINLLDEKKILAMDGEIVAGHLIYESEDKIIYVNSIYVDPEYRNRFLGKKLLDQCVAYARKEGFKIFPRCSYAARLFEKTDKYDDVKII